MVFRPDYGAINASDIWNLHVKPLMEYVRNRHRAAAEELAITDPVASAAFTNRAAALDEVIRMPEEARYQVTEEECEEKNAGRPNTRRYGLAGIDW